MTSRPNGVNLQFSSFKSKEEYIPPSGIAESSKIATNKRNIPRGEWAEEDPEPVTQKQEPAKAVQPQAATKTSGFSFITKTAKTTKIETTAPTPSSTNTLPRLLTFDEVRSDD